MRFCGRISASISAAALIFGMAATSAAQNLSCSLQDYKAVTGVKAEQNGPALSLTWQGRVEPGAQSPVYAAQRPARHSGACCARRQRSVGHPRQRAYAGLPGHHRPPPHLDSQRKLLKAQGHDTPEQEDISKWNTFWDAPLVIPGHHDSTDLPRKPEEIRRASVSYKSDNCRVATTGSRVSVTFNGLALGIFSGDLQFTAYKGSNLLRQEAIAKTSEPSVAYIYKAGLKGFTINNDSKVVWRDTARAWQEYSFGGSPNAEPVNLRARNRLEILDSGAGSLAIFPPPHKFFFARENEVNLGYVYYRKDSPNIFLSRRDAARTWRGLPSLGRL